MGEVVTGEMIDAAEFTHRMHDLVPLSGQLGLIATRIDAVTLSAVLREQVGARFHLQFGRLGGQGRCTCGRHHARGAGTLGSHDWPGKCSKFFPDQAGAIKFAHQLIQIPRLLGQH